MKWFRFKSVDKLRNQALPSLRSITVWSSGSHEAIFHLCPAWAIDGTNGSCALLSSRVSVDVGNYDLMLIAVVKPALTVRQVCARSAHCTTSLRKVRVMISMGAVDVYNNGRTGGGSTLLLLRGECNTLQFWK